MLQEGDGCFDGLQSQFGGIRRLPGVTRRGRAGCGVLLRLRGHVGVAGCDCGDTRDEGLTVPWGFGAGLTKVVLPGVGAWAGEPELLFFGALQLSGSITGGPRAGCCLRDTLSGSKTTTGGRSFRSQPTVFSQVPRRNSTK